MKIAPFLFLVVLATSCTKNQHVTKTQNQKQAYGQTESCTFGRVVYNTSKRPAVNEEQSRKNGGTSNELPPPTTPAATILISFGGYRVSNTPWNTNGDIYCAGANLSPDEIEKVLTRVKEDFAPFNVTVTTNEMTYHLTHPQKRMRVVVTESWEWHGMAGGVAFYDSFTWGNDTPCFVFSTLLSYNEKYIAEAVSHEVGHTLGLKHQASYSSSCQFLNEFNEGGGEGLMSWAPIMGNSYYRNVTTWHKGKTSSCGDLQDDVANIAAIIGFKKDETSDMANAVELKANLYAVMNNSTDTDYYFIDSKDPITITVSPKCIGNDIGANMHLQVKVYKKNGNLVATVANQSSLSVSAPLDKGKYYVAVETFDNMHQTRYGMLGNYGVSIN